MGCEIVNAVKILSLLFRSMAPCCLASENMYKISKKPASSILKVDLDTFQEIFPVIRNDSHYFRNGTYGFKIFFFLRSAGY
jgi:hypothetical protein